MDEKKTAISTVEELNEDGSKSLPQDRPNGQTQQNLFEPRHLTEDQFWETLYDALDYGIIAITIALLVKTSLCIYAYYHDAPNRGLTLDAASLLSRGLIYLNGQLVTAFTIIFGVILSTVVKRYARYRAQRGANIADLEQLQASVTLTSTVKMVWSLRKFTTLSFILVSTWSFYYTGSQASKREYVVVFGNSSHYLTGAYPNSTAAFVNFDDSTWPAGSITDLLKLYPGYVQAKHPPKPKNQLSYGVDDQDNFQIPRVPFINGTTNNGTIKHVKSSTQDYMTAGRPLLVAQNKSIEFAYSGSSQNDKTIFYTEWTQPKVTGKFDLKTSVISVTCFSVDVLPASQFPNGVIESLSQSLNVTKIPGMNNSAARQLQFWELDWVDTASSPSTVPTTNANGTVEISDYQQVAMKYTCNLFEPQIHIKVKCSETACLVDRLDVPRTEPSDLVDTPFSNATFSQSFFDTLLLAGGVPQSRENFTFISNFLVSAISATDVVGNASDPERVSAGLDFISNQLTDVINAYLNVIIRANYPSWTRAYTDDAIETLDASPDDPRNCQPLRWKGTTWEPHYQIYWPWIAIDYVSGLILLACSIFALWLRKHTLVPDIFGFVSSLTRDNPYFPVPDGGSTLDGIHRTRALRKIYVKVADVSNPGDPNGRLGFVPVQAPLHTAKLKKDFKYI